VLAAMLIVALVLTVLLEFVGADLRARRAAVELRDEIGVAQGVVDSLSLLPLRKLERSSSGWRDGPSGFGAFRWSARVTRNPSLEDLVTLTVVVRGRGRAFTLATRLYRPPRKSLAAKNAMNGVVPDGR